MLRMQLLGDLRLSRDGAELPASASRRSWVLLAWLALHRGQHPRGVVAAAFWPDVLDASARGSLRSAVWSVRRTLGVATEDYLVLDRDRIGFRDDAELRLDVDEVAELVRTGRLAEAAHAGAAELLPGLDDDWVLEARDAHRRSMLDLLETLARRAGAEGRVDEAVGWTRRQLVLDPDADEPVRRLMVLLDAAGDRTGAVRAYERHVDRLARELRTEPGEELTHLAEELRAGGGPAEVARPDQGSPAAPLVGRAAEWATLRAAWRRARSGQPGVVVVTGEPGIGKTRLVSELADLARSEGARTASTAALDLGGAAPLGPWAELVVALVPTLERPPASAAWPAVLTRLVPDLDSRFDLAPLSYSLASADLERVRLFEAMVGFLGWAASRPVMLVLDDAHAADPASLDLLAHVCRRLVDRPVLIVLTCRSLPHRAAVDDLLHAMRSRGRLFAELALGALDDEEVARLAEQVAGLDPARVAQVVATAEGNPLLATEWAGALVRGEPRPPTSLVALVRSALHPLGTGPLTMARLLAVAGRGLDHHELGNLGLGRTEEVAAEVSACPLFASGQGRLGFRHALLRDAAYDEIPEPVRLALHGRMGRMLAERGPAVASEAARHLLVAGEEDAARDQLVAAAAHARSLASLDEAVALVLEAVQLTPTDGALLVELAELEALRVHAAESDACFERAVPLLRDPADLASAWVRRATWYRGALCYPHRVLDAARRAISTLDDAGLDAPELRAEALALWAWAEAVAGDAEVAERLLVDIHRMVGTGDVPDALAPAVNHARAFVLVRQGRFRESYAPQIAAAAASRRLGRPDLAYGAWANAACAATCAQELDRALDFLDRGLAELAGQGLSALEVHLQAGRAHLLARTGRVAEALEAAAGELTAAERLTDPALRATASHDVGLLALRLGDLPRAAALLTTALDEHAPVSRAMLRLSLAEALVGLGREDEAEEQLRRTALEPVGPGDLPEALVPRLTWLQGLVARGRGDRDLAARRLAESADGWRALVEHGSMAEDFVAVIADFGRPPILGLVEPERELERVLADLAALDVAERGAADAVVPR